MYNNAQGTMQPAFFLGGPAGIQTTQDRNVPGSLGALGVYDSSGQWYIPVRVGDAQADNDAINLSQLNAAFVAAGFAPPLKGLSGLYEGGASGGMFG